MLTPTTCISVVLGTGLATTVPSLWDQRWNMITSGATNALQMLDSVANALTPQNIRDFWDDEDDTRTDGNALLNNAQDSEGVGSSSATGQGDLVNQAVEYIQPPHAGGVLDKVVAFALVPQDGQDLLGVQENEENDHKSSGGTHDSAAGADNAQPHVEAISAVQAARLEAVVKDPALQAPDKSDLQREYNNPSGSRITGFPGNANKLLSDTRDTLGDEASPSGTGSAGADDHLTGAPAVDDDEPPQRKKVRLHGDESGSKPGNAFIYDPTTVFSASSPFLIMPRKDKRGKEGSKRLPKQRTPLKYSVKDGARRNQKGSTVSASSAFGQESDDSPNLTQSSEQSLNINSPNAVRGTTSQVSENQERKPARTNANYVMSGLNYIGNKMTAAYHNLNQIVKDKLQRLRFWS